MKPEDLEGIARKLLADEYESYCAGVSYPSYANLARSGCGEFTLRSIRAIVTALNYTHRDAQPAGAQGEADAAQLPECISQYRELIKGYMAQEKADREQLVKLTSELLAAKNQPASAAAINEQMKVAIGLVLEWDKRRGHIIPYRVRDPLHDVLKAAAEAEKAKGGV